MHICSMQVVNEPMKGLLLLKPTVFEDPRGYFFESYRHDFFQNLGCNDSFIQDNQSFSKANILRGLHFQNHPFAQTKFVRVVRGAVLDVVVDIRNGSPTYGKYFAVELTETNFLSLYIPVGFAHGFYTLEDNTLFTYKCSMYYDPKSEGGLLWNCPDLAIPWNAKNPVLSAKDELNPTLNNFISPFNF